MFFSVLCKWEVADQSKAQLTCQLLKLYKEEGSVLWKIGFRSTSETQIQFNHWMYAEEWKTLA